MATLQLMHISAILRGKLMPGSCTFKIAILIHFDSHFLNRIQAQNVETFGQNVCCNFTQLDTAHVDFDNFAALVLFNAIAIVIKFGKCRCHFVHVLAQGMQKEIIGDFDNDFREPQKQLGELQFLLVLEADLGLVGEYLVRAEVGVTSDGTDPGVGVQHVHGRVAFVLQHFVEAEDVLVIPVVG